jgi:hypothetical protein
MSDFPATTVKVTNIEPCGPAQVCITMQLVVDVNRLAEVSSDLMHTAVAQIQAQGVSKKNNPG